MFNFLKGLFAHDMKAKKSAGIAHYDDQGRQIVPVELIDASEYELPTSPEAKRSSGYSSGYSVGQIVDASSAVDLRGMINGNVSRHYFPANIATSGWQNVGTHVVYGEDNIIGIYSTGLPLNVNTASAIADAIWDEGTNALVDATLGPYGELDLAEADDGNEEEDEDDEDQDDDESDDS